MLDHGSHPLGIRSLPLLPGEAEYDLELASEDERLHSRAEGADKAPEGSAIEDGRVVERPRRDRVLQQKVR